MSNRLLVRMLGPFEVAVDDRAIAINGSKLRIALASLALSASRNVPMDLLAFHLWGDELPTDVRGSLYAVMRRLRRALGPGLIAVAHGAYQLRTDPESVDVHRFRRLVRASGHGLPDVEQALALWRGEPLQDVGSDRLLIEHVASLTEDWYSAVERRMDLLLESGQHHELVGELRDLCSRHPLREPLWTQLMVALYRSGRQADAVEVYHEIRNRLRDELGLDPGTGLQELYRVVISGDVVPDSPALLAHADPVPPRQLPSDVVRFIGREDDLRTLHMLLSNETEESPTTIAVLDGPGGIGKTALAVHWAHRMIDRFPDGQLYINLHGYDLEQAAEPAAALEILLRSLGASTERLPSDVDARSALLRTTLAGKRMLILLDNARDVEQVRPLLPGSGCLVLITSRNQLRGLAAREGAHRITLGHLTEQESIWLLGRVLGADRVEADPTAVTELARLCGYLPLALVIAAERATRQVAVPLADLISELKHERDRLDAFDARQDPATDLRAVFSWSYRALPAQVARMFRLLGIAPGPDISAPAAAALAGVSTVEARRLLDALVDANQVQHKHSGRYELHDLLRAYAIEQAHQHDTGESRMRALSRVLDWYLQTSFVARPLLHPGESAVSVAPPIAGVIPLDFATDQDAISWCVRERANLSAAIRLAHQLKLDDLCWRMAYATWPPLHMSCGWDEILNTHHIGLSAASRSGHIVGQAYMLSAIGTAHRGDGRLAKAADSLREALAMFRATGDEPGEAMALNNLGAVYRDLGRFEEALHCFELCYAMDSVQTEPGNMAISLHQLGLTMIAAGRYGEANELATEALELIRKVGHRRGEARILQTVATSYARLGAHDVAIEHYEQARSIYTDLGDRWYLGNTLLQLGRSLRDAGRPTQAREVWRRSLVILKDLCSPAIAELYTELATVA